MITIIKAYKNYDIAKIIYIYLLKKHSYQNTFFFFFIFNKNYLL